MAPDHKILIEQVIHELCGLASSSVLTDEQFDEFVYGLILRSEGYALRLQEFLEETK